VRTTTVHRTSLENARRIIAEGARIELGDPETTWGQGFYSSTRPAPDYGETGLTVALRITRPWIVWDTMRAADELEDMMAAIGTEDRHGALRAHGYNGVIAHYAGGEMVVVAFEDRQVKVVLEP
jgi:hypothetical protein